MLKRKIEIPNGLELQAEPRLVTQGDVPPPNVGAMEETAGGEYSSLRHLVWEDSEIVSMTGQQKLGIEGISFELRPPALLEIAGANSLGQRTADWPKLRFESVGKPPLAADSNQSNRVASAIDSVEAIDAKPEDRAGIEGNRHVLNPCRLTHWALTCAAGADR